MRGRAGPASPPTVLTLLGVLAIAMSAWGCSAEAEPGSSLPGMCNGRKDPDTLVAARAGVATANPPQASYTLNVRTDADGLPTGVIVLEQGNDRLYVDELCRLWGHVPGESAGQCPDAGSAEGSTTVHVVGIGSFRDGAEMVVRADMRQSQDGRFFRVRWRPIETDHESGEAAPTQVAGECAEGWDRYPGEGWAPLDTLEVQVDSVEPDTSTPGS